MGLKKEEIKFKCKCGKEIDMNNIPENFQYIGCNEENYPVFICKDCGEYVWG